MKKSSRISKKWFYEPEVVELASKIIPKCQVESIVASLRQFMMSVGECYSVPAYGTEESYYLYSGEFAGLAIIKFAVAAKKIEERSTDNDYIPVAEFAIKYHTTHQKVKNALQCSDSACSLKKIGGKWCFHRNLSSELHAYLVPLAENDIIHTGRWNIKKPNLHQIESRIAAFS